MISTPEKLESFGFIIQSNTESARTHINMHALLFLILRGVSLSSFPSYYISDIWQLHQKQKARMYMHISTVLLECSKVLYFYYAGLQNLFHQFVYRDTVLWHFYMLTFIFLM